MKKNLRPPKWAENLLRWYCKPRILEDLQGDLHEYFERNLKTRGIFQAKVIYVVDVLKFIRPYTIRKPDFLHVLIHWIMIGSYIRTSTRSLVRNGLFSSINIIGLAISMSVGLLMIIFLSDLYRYDDFHVKGDRIYRITTVDQFHDRPSMRLASSSVKAAQRIRENIAGVEEIAVMRRGFGGDAQIGDTRIPVEGLWADVSFFDVFTFPLLHGNPATALKEPYSMVVTEQTARKLFGRSDVLNQSIRFDTTDYVITGVMQNIPKLSHLRFETLISFSTVELQRPDFDGPFDSWENVYSNYIYLVASKGSDIDVIEGALDKICQAENALLDHRTISLELLPLSEIVVGEGLSNSIGPTLHKLVIWILMGLAVIVIVSACFNYTNLSVARSLRRSKEVGIRKVIGALRGHVLSQFITESVIIALLSLVFSFLLFLFLRIQFLSLEGFIQDLVSLEISLEIVLYFIGFAVLVGLMAGILPAVFYSKINAAIVLKDASAIRVFRSVNLRKALIVLQYTFSLIFITSTLIGYKQYKSFLTFDLGFKTDNIINVRMQGNKDEFLVKKLSEIPEIIDISKSRIVTSIGNMYGTQAKYIDPNDSAIVWLNFIDENYIPLHEHQLLAGKNFSKADKGAAGNEVIVNEELLRRFDVRDRLPRNAIGEVIKMDGKELVIVGVMNDFHYGTVESRIEPVAFRYSAAEPQGYLNLKVSSEDWTATLAKIESAWKEIDAVHPVDAQFYDERIQQTYSQFSVMLKVIGFLAFLAICISSMGLFGMVVFNTERRLKEISIRKVLGATEGKLIYLLSKGFLILLLVATCVALPLTYLLFDRVVLTNFVYHQPIGVFELLIGPASVIALALAMIGSQTLKVARTNPADVLKSD